ncbi:MAG: rhodanese-like domain-containing protein [Marinilabiliales bacterium]|nr:rhodanese-like domain-containing protein [Marinilabiliales bacterium]
MEKKFPLIALLVVVLALGLVILPKKENPAEITPKALLNAMNDKTRYLTADQVTHRIIENDPTLCLIDLRPAKDFKTFNLPGSVNLSPDSLLSASAQELYNQHGKDVVLLSNADLISERAWLLLTRYAVKRLYVLKGGMNEWSRTILNEQTLPSTASSSDLELQQFRSAARQYFTGEGPATAATEAPKPAAESVPVARKSPSTHGGC